MPLPLSRNTRVLSLLVCLFLVLSVFRTFRPPLRTAFACPSFPMSTLTAGACARMRADGFDASEAVVLKVCAQKKSNKTSCLPDAAQRNRWSERELRTGRRGRRLPRGMRAAPQTCATALAKRLIRVA